MIENKQSMPYQALLLVSFGGPEGPDDVMPFLENVLRGKPVPRERMLEVAEHYHHFGGVSPINGQNRDLLEAIRAEFQASGLPLKVYWGNRNWKPYLEDALRQMKEDGIQKSLAFFTSLYSCYSGCRQYRENIQAAQQAVGEDVPEVHKVRMGFNHPGFIEANADRLVEARTSLSPSQRAPLVLFTAHSIPMSMANNCTYEKQLRETARLVAEAARVENWELVFQSRSGSPHVPWLEPDVCDRIEKAAAEEHRQVIVAPIGFISDHMEVLFDLDTEARKLCERLGVEMARAGTPGTHPKFVSMIRELVEERLGLRDKKDAVGDLGAWHDVCPENCCQPGRPAARP